VTNSDGRFDPRSGKIDAYFAGDSHSLQEPYFVPRSRQGPEGAGYQVHGIWVDENELSFA
jgi:hypothetical protein